MTADKPTPVVPNLRFPEFRSAGEWHFQPHQRHRGADLREGWDEQGACP